MAHDRPARVAEEFQHEVSAIIARGLKDPRIVGFITVTGAKMSPDLREVVVYVSVLGEDPVRKKTPHMRFEWDGSIEEGDKIERLLREAKAKDGR